MSNEALVNVSSAPVLYINDLLGFGTAAFGVGRLLCQRYDDHTYAEL